MLPHSGPAFRCSVRLMDEAENVRDDGWDRGREEMDGESGRYLYLPAEHLHACRSLQCGRYVGIGSIGCGSTQVGVANCEWFAFALLPYVVCR
jgi:hypothetical protein